MHVVVADPGVGPWLVLLHQTPRSWDEFAAVVPYLKDYRVVIPDLPGYGNSPALPDNTIEAAAGAVAAVLDQLGAAQAHVVGHHFGGLVAYHLAASAPDRVQSLVLSSTPFIDAAERERRKDAPPFNAVAPRSDGGHLAQLWQRRCDYLARLDPAVLARYLRDVLAHPDPDRGHEAVAAYHSEAGVGRYRGPVLCLASARDPRAFGRRHAILGAFPGAREHVLETGDIASPETCPAEFSRAIVDFHAELAVL
jgi:pimeloyl-ACP methyl ester carboxylesterase